MDNAEFAKKLAAKTELDEKQAEAFVNAMAGALAECFKKGEKVVMAEFGSFFVRDDKTVQFNPSARLKELIG